jgi:hypothetical protein
VEDVLREGDVVFVKVLPSGREKLSLSRKYVNQVTGEDLDCSGALFAAEEERTTSMKAGTFEPTCHRCGTKGHVVSACPEALLVCAHLSS